MSTALAAVAGQLAGSGNHGKGDPYIAGATVLAWLTFLIWLLWTAANTRGGGR